jgi:hypothetical protein
VNRALYAQRLEQHQSGRISIREGRTGAPAKVCRDRCRKYIQIANGRDSLRFYVCVGSFSSGRPSIFSHSRISSRVKWPNGVAISSWGILDTVGGVSLTTETQSAAVDIPASESLTHHRRSVLHVDSTDGLGSRPWRNSRGRFKFLCTISSTTAKILRQ